MDISAPEKYAPRAIRINDVPDNIALLYVDGGVHAGKIVNISATGVLIAVRYPSKIRMLMPYGLTLQLNYPEQPRHIGPVVGTVMRIESDIDPEMASSNGVHIALTYDNAKTTKEVLGTIATICEERYLP